MLRARRRLAALLPLVGIVVGCQAPESSTVPWWRGIPARLTTASSSEAENWRRQHGYPGEAQPIPSRVIIGPLVPRGEPISTPKPQEDDGEPPENAAPKDAAAPGKLDPALPPSDEDANATKSPPQATEEDDAREEPTPAKKKAASKDEADDAPSQSDDGLSLDAPTKADAEKQKSEDE